MSYLNTSMTKRASLAALLGTGALGAAAGGLAGHYSSNKENNTPATALGALGGGAGATAGLAAIDRIPRLEGLDSKLSDVARMAREVTSLDRALQKLPAEPAHTLADEINASRIRQLRNTLDISAFENTPKWARSLAKSPKMRNALMLGTLGLGAAAGGTLGAKLGIMGGDALA